MDLLSSAHLTVIAVTLVACVTVTLAVRRDPGAPWVLPFVRTLAVALILNEIALRVVLVDRGEWSWATDLPLHLSDAAIVAAAVALWSPRSLPLAFELTYFWAFTATVQAIATPDLHHGPGSYFFYAFFVSHSGVLVAAALMTWGWGRVPRRGAVRRVFAATALLACAAGLASWLSGGNYMFLRRVPSGGSLLDVMGPWPWYLVSATALALVLLVALDRLRRWEPGRPWTLGPPRGPVGAEGPPSRPR
jgi:hypothetical integral membrane protein (TIGR02206 family)